MAHRGPGDARGDRLPFSFLWLNVSQFLGVLNDNVFRLLVIFVLLDKLGEARREWIIAVVTMIFVAPFLLFSDVAGVLADRVSKRAVIWWLKVLEAPIMLWGAWAVWSRSTWGMFGSLFAMCAQSAFYSPAKYGIIPELVSPRQLSRANAHLVGATYIAMIVGTFVPSWLLLNLLHRSYMGLSWFCVGMALVGLGATWPIPGTPPSGSHKRVSPWFPVDILRTLRSALPDRELFASILGSAYFFYVGAFLQQNGLLYGQDYLGLDWIEAGYIFPLAALGVAAGAWLAGKLSGPRVELGVAPLGALGLAVGCLALGGMQPRLGTALALVFFFGISSGLFVVPLNAFLQYRSEVRQRGQIIACANFLSFVFIALAAATLILLGDGLRWPPRWGFTAIGWLTLAVVGTAFATVPEFLSRLISLVVARGIYRLRVWEGAGLPARGPFVLVSNHVTALDACLLTFAAQRRLRCLVARELFTRPGLCRLLRWIGARPFGVDDSETARAEAVLAARQALRRGQPVCVFPEGALTRNGHMRPFLKEVELLLADDSVPAYPVYVQGAWGRVFSLRRRRIGMPLGSDSKTPVTVLLGRALPTGASAGTARRAVDELAACSLDLKKSEDRSLAHAALRAARRCWRRTAVMDTTGRRLSYGTMLAGALALAREMGGRNGARGGAVGLLLPPSVAGVVANLAVTLSGRTAVNLNYSGTLEGLRSAVEQAGLDRIVTSHALVSRVETVRALKGLVFIEEMVQGIGLGRRLAAWVMARYAPARWVLGRSAAGPDDAAAILFSSGSTGTPRGVVLSHHNILSNIEQFREVMDFHPRDRMACVLPFFHSFGYTCTLWCPLWLGLTACYHVSPLDTATVLSMVREHRLTVLLGTPSFLLAYARKGAREDFASLRIIVAGAEKLRPEVAAAFEATFGKSVLEGYGATELSPVVAVNVPDVEVRGIRQVGTKRGTVGHPLPGVCVKVVDDETGEESPPGTAGLLMVKGSNVMVGYLNDPAGTADVIRDGWYATRDVAKVDEEGFLTIVDRVSRFSKIGGEMVPHLAVEEALYKALGALEPVVFVTSVPDPQKGEQLVVLYTDAAGPVERLREIVSRSALPNLWRPKPDNYFRIPSVPKFPSGKLDLRALRAMAEEAMAERRGAAGRT